MNRTRTLHAALLMTLCVLTATVTATAQISKTGSAGNSAPIQVATNGERPTAAICDEICEQRLAKSLDALEKAERLIAALEGELAARKRLDDVNAEIIETKNALISEQAKLIGLLKKQSGRKISFFFGLVKIRY